MPWFYFAHANVAVIFTTVSLSPVSDQFNKPDRFPYLGGEWAFMLCEVTTSFRGEVLPPSNVFHEGFGTCRSHTPIVQLYSFVTVEWTFLNTHHLRMFKEHLYQNESVFVSPPGKAHGDTNLFCSSVAGVVGHRCKVTKKMCMDICNIIHLQ